MIILQNLIFFFFNIQGAGAGGSGSSSILQLIGPLIGSSSRVSTSLFFKSIICIYLCDNLENLIDYLFSYLIHKPSHLKKHSIIFLCYYEKKINKYPQQK